MKCKVIVEFTYELPDEEDERLEIYGRVDLEECVELDFEVDPMAAFHDASGLQVIGVDRL